MNHLHRFRAVLLLCGAVLFATSCDSGDVGEDPPLPPAGFDRPAMLANYANNVIVPAYEALLGSAGTVEAAINLFVAEPSATNLGVAQQALRNAWLAWQDANPFQFGPAESMALRTLVNTYPADVQQIETNIASGSYTLGSVANRAAGGFPALDYLLHGLGSTPEEILAFYTTDASAAGRLAYLQDNARFIAANVGATHDAWRAPNSYLSTFLSDEKAGVDVGSALGEMTNAMILHYERFLRDGKIGIPAGVRSAGVPRPMATEAYYGGYSLALALANIEAIERLFLGTSLNGADGPGLDENLQALGAADLSNDIKAALAETIAALEGLSDPLSAHIETHGDDVVAAFTTMQRLVVLLKADLASVLGITITFQDNDGD